MHTSNKTICLSLFALVFLIVGCTVNPVRTWLNYSYDAIERKDWQAAYRLMEDALVSDDPSLRKEATDLVGKYPQIRQGAYETFTKESLEKTYRVHGERAFSIENERLTKYQRSIATSEQYAQAAQNYQDTYGALIAEWQAREKGIQEAEQVKALLNATYQKELQEALSSGLIKTQGETQKLLESLRVGHTIRKSALSQLGHPSLGFENNSILTWPIRVEGETYTILPHFTRSREGVTHSLVLAFDQAGVLTDLSLVRIVK